MTSTRAIPLAAGQVGDQVRRRRFAAGLTLGALGGATGLSAAYLSRLEAGERNPSLATLFALAEALGTSAAALVSADGSDEPVVRTSDGVEREARGLWYRSLSPPGATGLDALAVRVPPDRALAGTDGHAGEEWLLVRAGRLALTVGDRAWELAPGDAAQFDATQPHRLEAVGGEEAEVVLVTGPPMRAVRGGHR